MHVERREPERSPASKQAPPAVQKAATTQLPPVPAAVRAPAAHAVTADTPLARVLEQAVQGRAATATQPAARQQSVLVLYTTDHAARVAALEAELPEARGQIVTTAPTAVPALTTLVFWGHGTSASLCDLKPADM